MFFTSPHWNTVMELERRTSCPKLVCNEKCPVICNYRKRQTQKVRLGQTLLTAARI